MENIEAMLCAYIEGDLDAAGRAEIERYLRDNPQHRKLLDELVSLRTVLRELPQIPAPAEVGDGLRNSAERSMLLDDGQTLSIAPRSGSRWRQYVAIAAIFLLTTGVGIVVYHMILPPLRPANFTQFSVTIGNDYDPAVPEPMAAAPAPTPDATQPTIAMARPAAPVTANGALANSSPSTLSDRQMRAVQDQMLHSNPGNGVTTNAGIASNAAPPAAYSYWVLDSVNSANARDKINSFLSTNGITYTPLTEQPTQAPGAGVLLPAKPMLPSPTRAAGANATAQLDLGDAAKAAATQPIQVLQTGQLNLPSDYIIVDLAQKQQVDFAGGYIIHGITQKQIGQLDDSLQAPDTRPTKHLYRVAFDDNSGATINSAQKRLQQIQPQESQLQQVAGKNVEQAQADLQQQAADQPVDVVILVPPPPASATTAPSPATQPTTQPDTR